MNSIPIAWSPTSGSSQPVPIAWVVLVVDLSATSGGTRLMEVRRITEEVT